MNWIAGSLWELVLKPLGGPRRQQRAKPRAAAVLRRKITRSRAIQDRYDALVEEMKTVYGIKIRKWRNSSSGVAWAIRYVGTGRIVKLIESPYPRGPMSCAIFLHEVGHHAIGLGVHKPRCLEEYHVWMWALGTMRQRGFNVTPAVEKRVRDSMKYAVAKARRRGMKNVPAELVAFV
jgi:hypothetical protein